MQFSTKGIWVQLQMFASNLIYLMLRGNSGKCYTSFRSVIFLVQYQRGFPID